MSHRTLLLVHLQTESGIQTTGCGRFEQTKWNSNRSHIQKIAIAITPIQNENENYISAKQLLLTLATCRIKECSSLFYVQKL
jgi:hypothetical protein